MKPLALGKAHRLCHLKAIERLFADASSRSSICYPLRMVWLQRAEPRQGAAPVQFLVTIPKKRLRLAVDRVKMRRRVREAYRLNRPDVPLDAELDVAFIYVADKLVDYPRVQRSMVRLLADIQKSFPSTEAPNE